LASVVLLAGCASGGPEPGRDPAPADPPAAVRVGGRDLALEGPLVHGNLALFVLRGPGGDGREWITLDQGLAAGTVLVAEKGAAQGRDEAEVNELTLENRSDRWLFLQAGDVVKGGKQDRVVGRDVALAPNSPPQGLDAFCVEHGRWVAGREGRWDGDVEIAQAANLQPSGGAGFALPSHSFSSNTALVNGPALRRAIQVAGSQQEVWREVASVERGASISQSGTVAFQVREGGGSAGMDNGGVGLSSTGTYNALLSVEKIVKAREDAVKALLDEVLRRPDAVGIVAAVDGEILGADCYDSPGILRAMARKIVESWAVDAVLPGEKGRPAAPTVSAPPTAEAVRAFLEDAGGAGRVEERPGHLRRVLREGKGAHVLEYRAAAGEEAEPLHVNWIRK
ncbi:MAG: hypothetical protein HUU06_13905, partial [Planctomycetaceae bacterium]|nr:hypothetical protein [Planctomycetaceae bacterium]